MNRRTLLGVLGATVTLAGCVQEADSEDRSETDPEGENERSATASVRDHFDDEPERPECEIAPESITVDDPDGEPNEYETVGTIPYPEPPETFTDDAVADYVEDFERAYITHAVLCDRRDDVLELANSIEERERLEWDDDVTIVYLRRIAGAARGVSERGTQWAADIGSTVACYAIDETGVARVQTGYYEPDEYDAEGPDPLTEGELVLAFDR